MKFLDTLFLVFCCAFLQAQTVVDFEEYNLELSSFLNGSDLSGGFSSGDIFLPNDYNLNYDSWSGWAISTMQDTLTPGFTNQYSAIVGSGAESSNTYAVTFVSGESTISVTNETHTISSLSVSNATYAYLSMLNGDSFSKKFGGETGEDPDWFLLSIQAFSKGASVEDPIEVYLADYRFDDSNDDYILKNWLEVDLSELSKVSRIDSLALALSSSDVGMFGMNTPAYFCIDNLILENQSTSIYEEKTENIIQVFPNPAGEVLNIKQDGNSSVLIFDTIGDKVLDIKQVGQQIDISGLSSGVYFGVNTKDGERNVFRFIKE